MREGGACDVHLEIEGSFADTAQAVIVKNPDGVEIMLSNEQESLKVAVDYKAQLVADVAAEAAGDGSVPLDVLAADGEVDEAADADAVDGDDSVLWEITNQVLADFKSELQARRQERLEALWANRW